MALAWKASEWTLLHTEVLNCRVMVVKLQKGDFVLKVVVAHFHHKHRLRFDQWNRGSTEHSMSEKQRCRTHFGASSASGYEVQHAGVENNPPIPPPPPVNLYHSQNRHTSIQGIHGHEQRSSQVVQIASTFQCTVFCGLHDVMVPAGGGG